VVRVPVYIKDMYRASCEVRTEIINIVYKKVDLLFVIVVRVPDFLTAMYCASCEVLTQFICYLEE
jgi:hypothetical protein